MRRVTLVAVFLVALAAPAWADFQAAWVAYERGDYATALREWRPFAEQGNATAQYHLGIMYGNGLGVPRDFAQAVKWYRLAAEQNNAVAQSNLGAMYDNGLGVPQDYAEAVRWFRKAAEQGDAAGQSNLGAMYANGRGVPQDYVQAHMWSKLAAAKLPPGEERDDAVMNRDVSAERMTPAQIAEAQKLAREWKLKPE